MIEKGVASPQRLMIIQSMVKSGLGTPVLSGSCANFCTISKVGVGVYQINFAKKPFTLAPEVMVTAVTDNRLVKVANITKTSVQVLTEDLTGNPAEADFHVLAIGTNARDLLG